MKTSPSSSPNTTTSSVEALAIIPIDLDIEEDFVATENLKRKMTSGSNSSNWPKLRSARAHMVAAQNATTPKPQSPKTTTPPPSPPKPTKSPVQSPSPPKPAPAPKCNSPTTVEGEPAHDEANSTVPNNPDGVGTKTPNSISTNFTLDEIELARVLQDILGDVEATTPSATATTPAPIPNTEENVTHTLEVSDSDENTQSISKYRVERRTPTVNEESPRSVGIESEFPEDQASTIGL